MSRDVTSDKWLSRSLCAAVALEAPQYERLVESQAPPPVPEPPGLGTVEAAAPTSFFSPAPPSALAPDLNGSEPSGPGVGVNLAC